MSTTHPTLGRGTSAIEWTEATWNPVTGCSKVSPGCAHCYAEALTARFAGRPGYPAEHRPWTPENAEHNVRLHPERLEQPLRWRRPRMVFVNSMSDLFHELVPGSFIEQAFAVMALAKHHTFQVLTKRPEEALRLFEDPMVVDRVTEHVEQLTRDAWGFEWPLPNVWMGVSIENARYTWRADVLREIPAAVRFISAEPLLGSLMSPRPTVHQSPMPGGWQHIAVAKPAPLDLTGIDWLIVGGESGGRQARPMHPEWAWELRDACIAQRMHGAFEHHRRPGHTAFFFKQWGSWAPSEPGLLEVGDTCISEDGSHYPIDENYVCAPNESDGTWMRYAGASPKSGGRELDGRTWDEMPTQAGAA